MYQINVKICWFPLSYSNVFVLRWGILLVINVKGTISSQLTGHGIGVISSDFCFPSSMLRLTQWLKITPHNHNWSYYRCCCINEPVIFSHCVHLELGHQFRALLKVCSDCDDIVPLTPSLRRPCIHAIFFPTACRTACKHAFCFLRVRPEAVSTRHSWLWQMLDDVYTRRCFSES